MRRLLDHAAGDLRYAMRALRRTPGFALVVIITLAVGVAAVTTIFSLVNTALLKAAPWPGAARLHALSEVGSHGRSFGLVSAPAIAMIEARSTSYDRLGASDDLPAQLATAEYTSSYTATRVDSAVLGMVGVPVALGRGFTADDFATDAPVMLVSDSIWHSVLGSSPAALGHALRVNGEMRTVVGVMPRGFRFPVRSDLWLPLSPSAATDPDSWFSLLGRLRPGVSIEQARTEVRVLEHSLPIQTVMKRANQLVVEDDMVDRGSPLIKVLAATFLVIAACVLLVACANIGNLLQVRAAGRRSEMAIRSSLGATTGRLIRQNFTESALLGALGGGLGVVLAAWAVKFMVALVPMSGMPSWISFSIDWRVVAFAFVLSIVTTVAFGLMPARLASRVDLASDLKTGAGATRGRDAARRGRFGVVIQLSLALTLSVSAAMMWRTWLRQVSVDPGYRTADVWHVYPEFNHARYATAPAVADLARRAADAFRRNPDLGPASVEAIFFGLAVDSATWRPGRADSVRDYNLYAAGDLDHSLNVQLRNRNENLIVSPEYFAILGQQVVQGRGLLPTDLIGAPPVAVVSREFARQVWHTDGVIGRQLQYGKHGTPLTVVGVVQDVKRRGFSGAGESAIPQLFVADGQAYSQNVQWLIRARAGDRAPAVIRTTMHGIDPDIAIGSIPTLADELARDLVITQVVGGIIAAFACCAFGLAMLGIYGLIAYGVTQRTREIGIRLALGGSAHDVLRLIVRQGMHYIVVGLGVGLVLALGVTRLLQRFLWEGSSFNIVAYAGAVLLFVVVGFAGCYLPARRAAHIDPLVALRAE